jgi:hypothetical protein
MTTNRFKRCTIKPHSWFEIQSNVKEDAPLRLLISAKIEVFDSKGLPKKVDGEMVALAARMSKDTEQEHWEVTVREWPHKLTASEQQPTIVAKFSHCGQITPHFWCMSGMSPGGSAVIAVGESTANKVSMYEVKNRSMTANGTSIVGKGKKIAVYQSRDFVEAVWISANGAYLAIGGDFSKAILYSVWSQQVLKGFDVHAICYGEALWLSDDCSVLVCGAGEWQKPTPCYYKLQGGLVTPTRWNVDGNCSIRTVNGDARSMAIAGSYALSVDRVVAFRSASCIYGVSQDSKSVCAYRGNDDITGSACAGKFGWTTMSMPRELDTTLQVDNVVTDASSVYILMVSTGSSSQAQIYQYQEDTVSDEWDPLNMRVLSDTGKEQPLTLWGIATSLANNTVYGQSEDGVYRYDGETDGWQKLGASLAGYYELAVSPSYIYTGKDCRISRHPIGTDREWTQGKCTQLNMRDAESDGDLELWTITAAPNGDVYGMNDSFVYRHGGGPDDQCGQKCAVHSKASYI